MSHLLEAMPFRLLCWEPGWLNVHAMKQWQPGNSGSLSIFAPLGSIVAPYRGQSTSFPGIYVVKPGRVNSNGCD